MAQRAGSSDVMRVSAARTLSLKVFIEQANANGREGLDTFDVTRVGTYNREN